MIKKSLIIPLVVLLAAAGLLFGIAGHLTGCQGSRPDQETDDAYLRVGCHIDVSSRHPDIRRTGAYSQMMHAVFNSVLFDQRMRMSAEVNRE